MERAITTAVAAERLGASEAFVRRMIEKRRLTPGSDGLLDPAQVEELAALLKRLRGGGVAALMGAIGEELDSGE